MRSGIVIELRCGDRERFERICKDRNAPQKHVWRAEIVPLSADGVGTSKIMRRTATSKTCVWRWQERFIQEGVEGLPAHAIVLSFDEKSQIQALDRSQPGLPLKKGRAGTITEDYKRNGTTTLCCCAYAFLQSRRLKAA